MNRKMKVSHIFFMFTLLAACSADMNKNSLSIKGYDCTNIQEHVLEHSLEEISGICFDERNNTFLAINDEQGIIYKLDAKTYKITDTYSFASKGDYEEIHILKDKLYVLRSDGKIYTMSYDGKQVSDIKSFEYDGSEEEFESFFISAPESLVLIPKKSKRDSKQKETRGILFNLKDGSISESAYILSWPGLSTVAKLQPSAIAIHPVSKYMYLLSSIEKRLIVLDAEWKVLEEYVLDAQRFPQPEGITFDAAANLYISNEGGDGRPALIFIPYKTK